MIVRSAQAGHHAPLDHGPDQRRVHGADTGRLHGDHEQIFPDPAEHQGQEALVVHDRQIHCSQDDVDEHVHDRHGDHDADDPLARAPVLPKLFMEQQSIDEAGAGGDDAQPQS